MSRESPPPSIVARIAGAVIGGGGTYLLLRLTGAWGLGHGVVIGIASGLAIAGAMFGPAVWRAVVELG
jgi:hypothetical protein